VAVARPALGDRPPDLCGHLFVKVGRLVAVDLDTEHGASNTSFSWVTMSILTRPRPPRVDGPSDVEALEALIEEARRRARRRRRGYVASALVAAAAGLLGFYGFSHGGAATGAQDPGEPTHVSPQARNVFAQLPGWIMYTNADSDWDGGWETIGLWAVDPTRPQGNASNIQSQATIGKASGLIWFRNTPAVAVPLDWSDDGTKLLIRELENETERLVVLNADGTETTVLRKRIPRLEQGASLSPDGSQIVYASLGSGKERAGIYVIKTDGGRPHLLRKAGRRQWYSGDGWARTLLVDPAFSPDGTKIAYIDGTYDPLEGGNGLRVMDADGSNVRVLLDSDGRLSDDIGADPRPVWSPDGSRLAFSTDNDIWVIGADGSGLRKLIPGGMNPSWSPDGSLIAYQRQKPNGEGGPLRIADADDGRTVQTFTYGGSGPWNPLEPASD
jgi:Tol biopolymer transport system component